MAFLNWYSVGGAGMTGRVITIEGWKTVTSVRRITATQGRY